MSGLRSHIIIGRRPRQVACIVLLNWAAPGAYRSKVQKWQKEILGTALTKLPGAIGVLLSPVYYHKKGNLWACEHAHMQMLSVEGVNTDRMAALLFKGRRDERDSRQRHLSCWQLGRPCGCLPSQNGPITCSMVQVAPLFRLPHRSLPTHS